MNVTPILVEPCGECSACRLRVEIVKCLAFVDQRMVPPYLQALEELRAAKIAERDRPVLDMLARTASRRKAEWALAREGFLTPDVLMRIGCERVVPRLLVEP